MDNKQMELPGFESDDLNSEAVKRHYQEIGEATERSRMLVGNLGDRQQFIYSIMIRWPRKKSDDVLLIAKAMTVDGCVIAFHSGHAWNHLINSFCARIQAGRVNWQEDEHPPENWTEQLQVMASLPRIRR